MLGDIFERDNLDWQTRELATVGMLSPLIGVEPQLQAHMRISMNTGITQAQLERLWQILKVGVDEQAGNRATSALERHLASMASPSR
ncbi:carboxymuconolactone decarboxylase family protein [Pseudomonas sp. HS6-2]|uniref:carboxymuconolactone decarboxylase family protein n=1 Tax=Pseudomonas sp. HS6-2 TaxID=3410986 RepID=UPI003BCB58BC